MSKKMCTFAAETAITMYKKHILFVLCLITMACVACGSRDTRRINQAEVLIYTDPDSAETLLREVERPAQLPDSLQAKYWLLLSRLRADREQSLSEDSMICRAAEWYRQEFLTLAARHSDGSAALPQVQQAAEHMAEAGILEAYYWWWNGNGDKTRQVLDRQETYAQEADALTGNHRCQALFLRSAADLAARNYDYKRVCAGIGQLLQIDDDCAVRPEETVRLYNILGLAYYMSGDYPKMADCFETAIAFSDSTGIDSAFAWSSVRRNYADLLGETGQYDRAIRMHETLAQKYERADDWALAETLFSLSRLWLMKGDKTKARTYMQRAEQRRREMPEREREASVEATILAQRQVLDYALAGQYSMIPLTQFNNRWEERDYMRYRVAEARERQMRDLRERNLRLTLSHQRAVFAGIIALLLGVAIVLVLAILYKKRQRALLEKEEEIETLRSLLTEKKTRTDEDIRRMMLQQLGVIRALAGNPTEANQKMLGRLLRMDEKSADALLNWEILYHTIDLGYEGFYTYLSSHYGDVLNAREIQLCCLLRAGFSTKETNMLTRQSMQTIYQRKSQIRAKLHLQEGEDIIPFLTKLQQ